jgi:hypothetical protein
VFEASKSQWIMVLAWSFHDFEELVTLEPTAVSCYVSSASESFNEEMEIYFERLVNWLRHCERRNTTCTVSGHMMPCNSRQLCGRLGQSRFFR